MKERARDLARVAGASLALLLLIGVSEGCNDRFEFDIPTPGASAAAGAAQAGTSGSSGGATVAGSSFGGGSNGGSGGAGSPAQAGSSSACGEHPACPGALRCVSGQCYECASDLDCTSEGMTRCDSQRHRCVGCLEMSDCASGFACDSLANRCLRICSETIECPADAHGCDERRGVCYECDEDYECADSPLGSLCASDGSGCVACRTDLDCGTKRCEQLAGRCVECRDGRDCSSGLCEPVAGNCLPA